MALFSPSPSKHNYAPEVHSYEAPEVYQSGPEFPQPGLEVPQRHLIGDEKASAYHEVALPPASNQPAPRKKILGLRITTFCLLLALIVAIAAAIVAGVTASELHCKNITTSSGSSSQPTVTVTLTPSSTTTSSASAAPTSDCTSEDAYYKSNSTQLTYGKFCNTYLDSGSVDYSNLFTSHADSLDGCIGNCDSYNFWTSTRNASVAVWNWIGGSNQEPGRCWCVNVEGEFNLTVTSGQDSARVLRPAL